jgi:hypothetical protein
MIMDIELTDSTLLYLPIFLYTHLIATQLKSFIPLLTLYMVLYNFWNIILGLSVSD